MWRNCSRAETTLLDGYVSRRNAGTTGHALSIHRVSAAQIQQKEGKKRKKKKKRPFTATGQHNTLIRTTPPPPFWKLFDRPLGWKLSGDLYSAAADARMWLTGAGPKYASIVAESSASCRRNWNASGRHTESTVMISDCVSSQSPQRFCAALDSFKAAQRRGQILANTLSFVSHSNPLFGCFPIPIPMHSLSVSIEPTISPVTSSPASKFSATLMKMWRLESNEYIMSI
jgi:hypothetical protein